MKFASLISALLCGLAVTMLAVVQASPDATLDAQENTWAYRSSERETRLAPDGSVAWFDETLQHDQLGHGRGTGAAIRDTAEEEVHGDEP